MIDVADASINTFGTLSPKADFVPPSEQLITLTYGQLQDLIKEAIQPLQDRIESLEATVARQGEKIAALEALQLQDVDRLALDIAYDRQRLAKLENRPAPEATKKTTNHIDELHRLMLEEKTQQVSIAKASRLLGITKERVRQLKPLILADGRFEIGWSNLKGQKGVVIRIRQYLK